MRAEAALLGPRHPSALAEALTFGSFNKAFQPARTPFDWLSRDPAEVDAYIADPCCGFLCSAALWSDLFTAGAPLLNHARLCRIPKTLPILLICGDCDPVSAGVKGPRQLADAYRAAGVQRVEVKAYAEGRHELLNDVCREQTTADMLAWMRATLA
jgi:alpha-beta hydrolase superfamily lysophospholipase